MLSRRWLAAAELGWGHRLIGLHLVLELQRACLVQAMLLRDRTEGTRCHRSGTARDDLADEVAGAQLSLDVSSRPNIVEQTVERYGRWRGELEADYRPDWWGLCRLIDLGLAAC